MDWPPPSRRSSNARREQNLALVGAVVSGAVVAMALGLLLLGRVNPELGGRTRGVVLDIVAPVWGAVRAPFDWLGDVGSTIGEYIGTVPRNRVLAAELAAAQRALQHQEALQAENGALKRLLKVVEPRQQLIAVARIAGSSAGSYARTAMISAGRSQGIVPGQPVRADVGLVGRTVEAGDHAARILLLTDTNSRVPVIVVRTGQPALAAGANARLLEVRDRTGAEVPLLAGDRLVTSGAGGTFAPQIPVAVIVDAAREPPLAEPFANPAALTHVAVYAPYLPVPVLAALTDAATVVPVPREAGRRIARSSGKRPPATPAATTPAAAAATP